MRQLMDVCSGIQHIGIPTDNMEKTCAFYTELGFEKVFETTLHETQGVVFLRFCNVTLEIYEGDCAKRAGAVDHIAIDCKDVETAYKFAMEKGYPVVSDGIEELPFWEKGVRFFTIEGPNGEKVELNQYL